MNPSGPPGERPVEGASAVVEAAVGIVVPCHDDGRFLGEALTSVRLYAGLHHELIVVDDGSRDAATLELLATLERQGYRVVRQARAGAAAARNRGIGLLRAPFFLALDADNRLRPRLLERAIEVLERDPRVGVVYGARWEFGDRQRLVEPPEFDLDALLLANFIDTGAVVRRTAWAEVGGYDTALGNWEDWELWIALARRGWRFHRLAGGATLDYRVRRGSKSRPIEDDAARGEAVRRHIFGKHRELFEGRVERLLTMAQYRALEIDRCRLRLEGERAALELQAADLERRLEASERRCAELADRVEALTAELERPAAVARRAG